MWLLIRTAWRNLFRQRRRTLITASAMAVSLAMAIPTYGLILGVRAQFLKGITGMDLGHIQLHDPAYPRGRAMQSTLRRPDLLLEAIRAIRGVVAASDRVYGFGLVSHDVRVPLSLVPLPPEHPALRGEAVLFGRALKSTAPWRRDSALDCEALVDNESAKQHAVVVGSVLAPKAARQGGACERIRIVGLLKRPLGSAAERQNKALAVGLAQQDVQRAFATTRFTQAISRNTSPIAIMGVDPAQERRVTFMAKRVTEGRYLANRPAREIVVGFRLARIMRLRVGAKVFVQTATLDYASGAFYQNFKVVGIYKTGVDSVDRTRVFIHIGDARKVMSLGNRAHEIVIIGIDQKTLGPLVAEVRQRISKLRLRITTGREGLRAGSRPLPAPITILDPRAGDAGLLIPDDLQRRFDGLKGLHAVARRVYGKTDVSPVRRLKVHIVQLPEASLQKLVGTLSKDRCAVYVPGKLARRWGLRVGQRVLPSSAVGDDAIGCARLTIAGLLPLPPPSVPAAADGLSPPSAQIPRILAPAPSEGVDDDEQGVQAGAMSLLIPGKATSLRLVGVEPDRERRLSALHRQVAVGKYLPTGRRQGEGDWPVLLPNHVAKRLGVAVGATLLLKVRDEDARTRWRAARVVGLLRGWAAEQPELVMPYYPAQQVDAPTLNARAHELLLLPEKGMNPEDLAAAASERLLPLVRPWDEIRPQMKELVAMQNMFMSIMLFIIFIIAGMTVMNTMLMAVFERIREFGVLKSIGMRPRQVFGLIVLETLFLAVLAAALGGGAGVGLDQYLVVHGLDMSGITGGFTAQGTFINPVWKAVFSIQGVYMPMLMMSLVCLVVSFYPALKAGRIKPVVAMRHHN
ncbi:MAG: FtsX-like permease family protein [bacterium]